MGDFEPDCIECGQPCGTGSFILARDEYAMGYEVVHQHCKTSEHEPLMAAAGRRLEHVRTAPLPYPDQVHPDNGAAARAHLERLRDA
jgi:hypothetical protein